MRRLIAVALALALLSGCAATKSEPEIELPTEPTEVVGGAPLASDTEEPTQEENWIQVEHGKGHANVSLSLPEHWQVELVEGTEAEVWPFCVRFRPEGAWEDGHLTLYFYPELFGVCGTGLESKEVTFASGHTASIGTYDGGPLWSFISFRDTPGSYVVQNEGAKSWWTDHGDTAMEIINTIRVGARIVDRETAIEAATAVCTVEYNRVYDRFDYESGRWMVLFSKDGDDGGQVVWIDPTGGVDEVTEEA